MTYEYIAYIALSLLTIFLAIKGIQKASAKYDFVIFVALVTLSFIVRANPHDDMIVYINSMKLSFRDMLSQPYYLKNILFWGSNSLLYSAGLSPNLILLIWDIITFVLMLKVRKNTGLPYYFIPLFYTSFVGIFGLQNIYRQYIASILLLYIVTTSFRKQWKFYLLLVLTALIHSGSIIFAGAIWVKAQKKMPSGYWYILMLAMVVMLSPKLFATNHPENTGSNFNILYLGTILFGATFCLFTQRTMRRKIDFGKDFLTIVYLLVIAFSAFLVQRTSLYYERIGLFILPLIMMYCVKYIRYYSQRRMMNVAFSLLLIFPTFSFTATQLMLYNATLLPE